MSAPISRGFRGKRQGDGTANRVPPGQYVTSDFPVLSAGPTPYLPIGKWSFTLEDSEQRELGRWSWEELRALPATEITVDIHCVTKWTKLGTTWKGVRFDDLLGDRDPPGAYIMAFCEGGYTTNVPVADLRGDRALIAYQYEGKPLHSEHGGPARLLVPHLYFWKSAKWVRGLRFQATDQPGFWEKNGYHLYGDPWKEQRYDGD